MPVTFRTSRESGMLQFVTNRRPGAGCGRGNEQYVHSLLLTLGRTLTTLILSSHTGQEGITHPRDIKQEGITTVVHRRREEYPPLCTEGERNTHREAKAGGNNPP